MLFAIGWVCYNQSFVAQDLEREIQQSDEAIENYNNIINNDATQLRRQKIEDLMDEKQIYRHKDLRITDLAMMLGTNRTYLSQTINKEYGLNFSDFINRYRVQYAKKILGQKSMKPYKTIIDEAMFSAGFSSESTFYRAFKSETGVSPKEWMHRLNSNNTGEDACIQ